jgi:Succinate dehydrogenase/fumarate reductase, Fe-S protein subunit
LCRYEEKMDLDFVDEVYELDCCIECGCCVVVCGTVHMWIDFVGGVGLNKVVCFSLDSRDERSDVDMYELVGNDDGVFGCMLLFVCNDFCSKELSL